MTLYTIQGVFALEQLDDYVLTAHDGCMKCGGKFTSAPHGFATLQECGWCERIRLGRRYALLRQAECEVVEWIKVIRIYQEAQELRSTLD